MDFRLRYKYDTKTDFLGKGGFATVYRAYDTLLERAVAVKFFTNYDEKKYNLINEIRKSIKLEHPNICRYYDAAILEGKNVHGDPEQTEVGIMEYLDGGNIKEYLQQYPYHMNRLLKHTLTGLMYLHGKRIIHRDIKPGNVLVKLLDLDEISGMPLAKITDFGISKLLDADANSSSKTIGSLAYMAPEQLEPMGYGINGEVTTNADIWSFGALAYELVTGKMLFEHIDNQTSGQALHRILNEDYTKKIKEVAPPYRELLEKCLVRKASERCMDCGELVRVLERVAVNANVSQRDNNSQAGGHLNLKKDEPARKEPNEDTILIQKANSEQRPALNTPSNAIIGKIAIGAVFLILLIAAIIFVVKRENSEATYLTDYAVDNGEVTEPAAPADVPQKVDATEISNVPPSEGQNSEQDAMAPLLSDEERQKRKRYLGKHLLGVFSLDYDNSFGSVTIELKDDGVYYLKGSQKNKLGDWVKINGTINIINLSKFYFTGTVSVHMPGRKNIQDNSLPGYRPEPSSPDCEENGEFLFELFSPGSKHWRMRGKNGMNGDPDEPCFRLTSNIDIYF